MLNKNTMKEVLEYIKNNWEKSIRPANDMGLLLRTSMKRPKCSAGQRGYTASLSRI